MKIKTDFITNSSSSSFLVVFGDTLPATIEEMKKVLFGDKKEFQHPYEDISYWSTEEVTEVVLSQTTEASIEDIQFFFEGEFSPYLYDACKKKEGGLDWEKYDAERKIMSAQQAAEFMALYPGQKFSIYEWGDDDSLGCAMEHGNLFKKLISYRVSHH